MATLRFYRNLYLSSSYVMIKDLCRWLTNDHATETGPGMKIVCAYDASQGAGSKKVLPTAGDETNWENAAFAAVSGFAWTSTNTLADGDWVVLQSTLASNPWQVAFLCAGSNVVNFVLMSSAGFNTAQAEASPPTLPTKTIYSTGTTWFSMSNRSGYHYACAISDGEFFAFHDHFAGFGLCSAYGGILDGARSADTKPYCAYGSVAYPSLNNSKLTKRISPVDDSTLIDGYVDVPYAHNCGSSYYGEGVLGEVLPSGQISISWITTGHKHFGGYLRNIYALFLYLGCIGTLSVGGSSYQYAFFGNNVGLANVVFKWDGATPVG